MFTSVVHKRDSLVKREISHLVFKMTTQRNSVTLTTESCITECNNIVSYESLDT